MPSHWFVKATVSAQIEATTQAEAAQELCDRLAHGVPDQYGVNMVDAMEVGYKMDPNDEAGILEWLEKNRDRLGPGDDARSFGDES